MEKEILTCPICRAELNVIEAVQIRSFRALEMQCPLCTFERTLTFDQDKIIKTDRTTEVTTIFKYSELLKIYEANKDRNGL